MSKYSERLGKDDKTLKAEAIVLKEASSKAAVEKYIAEKNQRVTTLAQAYESALSESPLNVDKVAGILAEQDANNAALALGKKLLTEEF